MRTFAQALLCFLSCNARKCSIKRLMRQSLLLRHSFTDRNLRALQRCQLCRCTRQIKSNKTKKATDKGRAEKGGISSKTRAFSSFSTCFSSHSGYYDTLCQPSLSLSLSLWYTHTPLSVQLCEDLHWFPFIFHSLVQLSLTLTSVHALPLNLSLWGDVRAGHNVLTSKKCLHSTQVPTMTSWKSSFKIKIIFFFTIHRVVTGQMAPLPLTWCVWLAWCLISVACPSPSGQNTPRFTAKPLRLISTPLA